MTRIILDAMGSDNAPKNETEGALVAVRELGIEISLAGPRSVVQAELDKHPGYPISAIQVVDAPQVIAMDEPVAQAIRRKPQSSISVGMQLVQEGKADGFVSAGNTGAIMVIAKMVMKMIGELDRPAVGAVLPTLTGRPALLLDVGANAECKPLHLLQFAIMGDIYARSIMDVKSPQVGLVSIGEEQLKGNELTRETHKLLSQSALQFIGNVEGQGVFSGKADVVVCDGFTGNVILKVSEGLSEMLLKVFQQEFVEKESSVGSGLSLEAFREFRRRFDYEESGGAPLLGIKNVCVICHGRSGQRAIANAIKMAVDLVEKRVPERIGAEMAQLKALAIRD
jgi:phosphate acyltransferase